MSATKAPDGAGLVDDVQRMWRDARTKDPTRAALANPLLLRADTDQIAEMFFGIGVFEAAKVIVAARHASRPAPDGVTLTLTRDELELVRRALISRAAVHPCDMPAARDAARSAEAKLRDAIREADQS